MVNRRALVSGQFRPEDVASTPLAITRVSGEGDHLGFTVVNREVRRGVFNGYLFRAPG